MDVYRLEKAIDNNRLTLAEIRFVHYFFDQTKDYERGLEELLRYSDDKEIAEVKYPDMPLREHFLLSASIREKLKTQTGET